ncbi:MAG: hypothetical protein U0Q16_29885 [Bryobacteraceae bacterium]
MAASFLFAFAVISADLTGVRPGPVRVTPAAEAVRVDWADDRGQPWTAEFSLDPKKPLISAISQAGAVVLDRAQPYYTVETGKRRGGWDQFFDYPPSHPDGTRRFQAQFTPAALKARTKGDRVEVRVEGLQLGIFSGAIVYTFFPGSRLVQQEASVSTQEPDTAFFYDAGIQWAAESDRKPGNTMQTRVAWYDQENHLQTKMLNFFASERQPFAVRYRTLSAATANGSVAVFPSPHQYFMPRDFTSNLAHLWARSFRGTAALGIRQLPDENWIFYPWMNAPPGSEQHLSMFLVLSRDQPAVVLEEVLRYTNRDRFPRLPGYRTLASHWHLAYTVQAMEYGDAWVPPFKPVLKDMGIDAALIADFHGDGHPADKTDLRLKELDAYYRVAKAQSDGDFLIIPGEEANAHFGGHWILSFPKPVLWFMSRAEGQPFEEQHPKYGKVYRTGNSADMLELIKRENGIAYTAHPRTKGSLGYPDKYKDSEFFRDPHFLGAGWKQMPANLSTPRMGLRALNLVDDLANWGFRKRLIPEVDMFQLDSTHELYAHMNAAYVKIDALPKWDDYGKMLEALGRGDYFASTGEVHLPEVKFAPVGRVEAKVRWTLPLAQAVVISGDGTTVKREAVPLDATRAFGEQTFQWSAANPGAKWIRLEVWDVAGNGAFTTPNWYGPK